MNVEVLWSHLMERVIKLQDRGKFIPVRSPSTKYNGANAWIDDIPHIKEDLWRWRGDDYALRQIEPEIKRCEELAHNMPVRWAIPYSRPNLRGLYVSLWDGVMYVLYHEVGHKMHLASYSMNSLTRLHKITLDRVFDNQIVTQVGLLAGPDSTVSVFHGPPFTLLQYSLADLGFVAERTNISTIWAGHTVFAADGYIYRAVGTRLFRYSGSYPYTYLATCEGVGASRLDASSTSLFAHTASTVNKVSLSTFTRTGYWSIPFDGKWIAYGNGELFIFSGDDGTIAVYSTAGVLLRTLSGLPFKTFSTGIYDDVQFRYGSGHLFCVDLFSDTIHKIDASTGEVVRRRMLKK